MIDLQTILERLHVVSLPLHTRFRGVSVRECALIEGTHGWGEFSPFLEYPPAEARFWLDAALEAAFTELPEPIRTSVEINATVPAVSADAVPAILDRFDGATTAKVKVAEGSLADDLARIAAVREHIPGVRIRVDANGAWSVDEAITALTAFRAQGPVEYAEQPVATIEELAQVRRHFQGEVLIAADESIRKSEDPYRVRDAEAADIAVLKVAPLGGVRRTLSIAADIEMPVVISSELSSSVGLGIGSIAAGCLPALPLACGLATAELLAADVAAPLAPRAGAIPVGRVLPDPALLAAYAAPTARQEWWRERVKACL